jgi:hypothetical protein
MVFIFFFSFVELNFSSGKSARKCDCDNYLIRNLTQTVSNIDLFGENFTITDFLGSFSDINEGEIKKKKNWKIILRYVLYFLIK